MPKNNKNKKESKNHFANTVSSVESKVQATPKARWKPKASTYLQEDDEQKTQFNEGSGQKFIEQDNIESSSTDTQRSMDSAKEALEAAPFLKRSLLGGSAKRSQAILSLPTLSVIPDNVIQQIRQNKVRGSKFKADELIKIEDGPQVLSEALNVELGFTAEKMLRIAKGLDRRIVVEAEGELFFDRSRLAEAFEAYLQRQQNESLLQLSRSSRTALRRNIIAREASAFLEEILTINSDLKNDLS